MVSWACWVSGTSFLPYCRRDTHLKISSHEVDGKTDIKPHRARVVARRVIPDEMNQCEFCQKEEGSFPSLFPAPQPCSVPKPALLQVAPSCETCLLAAHPIPSQAWVRTGSFPALPVDQKSWQKDPGNFKTGNRTVLLEMFWLKSMVDGSLNLPKVATVLHPPSPQHWCLPDPTVSWLRKPN